jgi:hypothetical protein
MIQQSAKSGDKEFKGGRGFVYISPAFVSSSTADVDLNRRGQRVRNGFLFELLLLNRRNSQAKASLAAVVDSNLMRVPERSQ